MEYEKFEKLMNEYRNGQQIISDLYDIGFDLMEGKYKMSDSLYNIFMASLETHYEVEGIDWISWFIWESDWGEKYWSSLPLYKRNEDGVMEMVKEHNRSGATDENGEPICYDMKSLWEYIEKEHKNKL